MSLRYSKAIGAPMLSTAAAFTVQGRAAVQHAVTREKEFYEIRALIAQDIESVPLHSLRVAAQSLVMVLIERGKHPEPHEESWGIARRLSAAAWMIAMLNTMDNYAYDLGVFDQRLATDFTLRDLERRFQEDRRGYRFEDTLRAKIYRRYHDEVLSLQKLFLEAAKGEQAWDLERHHDFHHAVMDEVIETGMEAALTLEANFEARIFGSTGQDGDDA